MDCLAYIFVYICELNMQEMNVISGHPIFISFRRLTGYQRDPRDRGGTNGTPRFWVVIAWYQSVGI